MKDLTDAELDSNIRINMGFLKIFQSKYKGAYYKMQMAEKLESNRRTSRNVLDVSCTSFR